MKASVWIAIACLAAVFAAELTAAETNAPAAAAVVKKQTMCPVMNAPIDPKLYVDFQGKRVYVCCNTCVRIVKKNPAKYVKMLEDQGVTLAAAEASKAPAGEKKP
jgi:uncharacterized secreted protein with C-terminal beta-propeller domain